METYPKSGKRLLGFPAATGSSSSSVDKKKKKPHNDQKQPKTNQSACFHDIYSFLPFDPLLFPFDSLFLALRMKPEGDEASFTEGGLPQLSMLSPCDGERDGLLDISALLWDASLEETGSSLCPLTE